MFVLASFAGLWYLCFFPAPGFPGFSSLQSQVQSRFVNFRQPSTGLLLAKPLQAKTGKPWISITSEPIVFWNNPNKDSTEKQPWFYLEFELRLVISGLLFASLHTYIRNLAPFFKNQLWIELNSFQGLRHLGTWERPHMYEWNADLVWIRDLAPFVEQLVCSLNLVHMQSICY